MVNEVLKTLSGSTEILKEVYTDLAKPGVAQAGKALGTIIGLGNTVLSPVTLINEKASIRLKLNLEQYRKKLEGTPEDEICEVPPEIGVPVVEKLGYVTNEELSDKYAELLAKSSKVKTANEAHPSFVNVLSNLSPDEILLLTEFKGLKGIPYVEVRNLLPDSDGWVTLNPHFTEFTDLQSLSHSDNVNVYINNLERLGILKNMGSVYMKGTEIEKKYKELTELSEKKYEIYSQASPVLEKIRTVEPKNDEEKKQLENLTQLLNDQLKGRKISCNKGKLEVTSYGALFLKAILPNEKK